MPDARKWFARKASVDLSSRMPTFRPLGVGSGPNRSAQTSPPPRDADGRKLKPIVAGETVVGGEEVAG